MYVVESRLTIVRDPETLLGQYGVFWTAKASPATPPIQGTSDSREFWMLSPSANLLNTLNRLQSIRAIPWDAEFLSIRTHEQAAKFAQISDYRNQLRRSSQPNLKAMREQGIPRGALAIAGTLSLMGERHTMTVGDQTLGARRTLRTFGFSPRGELSETGPRSKNSFAPPSPWRAFRESLAERIFTEAGLNSAPEMAPAYAASAA